jgi:flagellar protein FliJ
MFRFRLQRVLDLRARKERDAATALVSAQEQAERAREAQERLMAAREALAAQAAPGAAADAPNGPSVGVLRTLHYLLGRLDERVASAATDATTAEHEVVQRQDELRAAVTQRRTLDRLRDRHEESWRAAEAAADRQRMDEIALTRFQQPSAHKAGAAPPSDAENSSNES